MINLVLSWKAYQRGWDTYMFWAWAGAVELLAEVALVVIKVVG